MGNDQSAAVAPGMAPILAQPNMAPMASMPGGAQKAGSFALGEARSKSDIVTSAGGIPAFTRSSSDIVTSGQMLRDLDRRASAVPTLPVISEQTPAPASALPNYSLGQMPAMAPVQQSPANSFGALTPLETWPPSLSTLGRPGPANMQFQAPIASVEAKPMLAPMPTAQTPPVAPMPSMTPAQIPAPTKRTQATVLGTQMAPSSYGGFPTAMPNYAPSSNFVTSPVTSGLAPSRSCPTLPKVGATQMYGQAPSLGYQQRPASYQPGFASSAPSTSQPFAYSGSTLPMTAGYGYGGSGYGLPQTPYVQQANVFKPPQMPYTQQSNYLQPQVSAALPSYAQPQVSAALPSYGLPSYAQPQVSAAMPSYAQQMPGWGFPATSPGYSSISPQAPYQAPALNYSAASSAYGYVPPVASNLGFSGAVSNIPSMMGSFSPTSYAPSSFTPSNAGRVMGSGYLPQQGYASSPYRMF